MMAAVGRTAGHAPVIFLKLLDGSDRVLPVFIGEAEFSALHKELRQQTTLRPMTHDLMKSSLQAMGVTVTRVQVCVLLLLHSGGGGGKVGGLPTLYSFTHYARYLPPESDPTGFH